MQMLTRFSLYGFLKNLDFSEPFLVLFFLSLNLNFFQIGILLGFQNVLINVFEIPSGAFADLYGRKTSMIIALSSYVLAFIIFAFSNSFIDLFLPITLYALGDAFRTGTHKAMIFTWLKLHDRLDDRTKIYGFTRSWSNYGSAISVIFAVIIVIFLTNFRYVFVFSILPGLLGIWNMLGYPNELNIKQSIKISFKQVLNHSLTSVKTAILSKPIRALMLQNMVFESCFVVAKNYIQPLVQAQTFILMVYFSLSEDHATALFIGGFYFFLHIFSAWSSKNAHHVLKKIKSEQTTLNILLLCAGLLLALASGGMFSGLLLLTISSFIALFIMQNLWVPIHIAQYDNYSNIGNQASILSLASQAKSIGVAVLAPIAGLLADKFGIASTLLGIAGLPCIIFLFSLIHIKKAKTDRPPSE